MFCSIHTDVINRVGKAYNSGRASGVPGNVKLELYPEDYNLAANGKYRMDFEFFLDYGDGSANENKFSFTFYVDYEGGRLLAEQQLVLSRFAKGKQRGASR